MGYDRHTDYVERERDVFREICKAYGLEQREKEDEKGRGHTYSVTEYKHNAEQIRETDKKLREADMPTMPTLEPEKPVDVETPTRSQHISKQNQKTVKATKHFNYYAEKQKIQQEIREKMQQQRAEALIIENESEDYDKDIEV